jgi:DNA-binding Xre family transcriptional regulator
MQLVIEKSITIDCLVADNGTFMSQATVLMEVLKTALRQRKLTYAHIAKDLHLSESSVKRMFARQNMDLDRLEKICALMNLEIADMLELTRHAQGRITELTEEQELELVSDPKLLVVGVLATSQWSVARILENYRLSESELIKMLRRLERMKVIDLLPDKRIKVRLPRNFSWRRSGPIQRFFEERVQKQFFDSSFLGAGELRISVHGSLSYHSIELLQQRMRKIAEEFDALTDEDKQLDHDKREGTTLVMAIRPWELSLFTELRRKIASGSAPPVRNARIRTPIARSLP